MVSSAIRRHPDRDRHGRRRVASVNRDAASRLHCTHDEWYDFQTNVASNPLVHVLLTVDESTYTGGTMGAVHPIAWYQDTGTDDRGTPRWATSFRCTLDPFADHLLGGILWAAGSSRTSTVCGAQAYGVSSGAAPLALGGTLVLPTHATIQLSGATAGGSGLLGVSSCSASATGGGITVLVDLASPGFVGLFPVAFDPSGQTQIVIPLVLQLPGSWGTSLYLQGAQLSPALGLSNGLQVSLCP